MGSTASWWASKARQFRAHLGARVDPDERAGLVAWLTPAQLEVFDRMHVADQRHGLDVVATLRAPDGAADPGADRAPGAPDHDLLVAGLLHDAGKGPTGVVPRVAYSLGQAYGTWIWTVSGAVPGFGAPMARLRDHAQLSAVLAEQAGCSPRTVELIRHQDAPIDLPDGRRLQLADDAN
jgi:hypothetical protein